MLRDIFDSLPKIGKETINTIDFFIATRKNPLLRGLSSAIARDPDACSRIPRETFQQVFDRMENEIQAKQLEWATIVEYFTKRGRPLTKEEMQRLVEEDRRQKEEEETKKRHDEEQDRRRMARLMEDLEDKEDFEEFEMRQKSEQAAKILSDKQYEYPRESDNEEEEDLDREEEEVNGYRSDPEMGTAQRDYKFGGGSHPEERKRAQSAKSRGKSYESERDLRSMKLTTQDYIDRESQKKQGKYGVTVPKPFNFDVREKTRPKTIREKKIEQMVAEKKVEEENHLRY